MPDGASKTPSGKDSETFSKTKHQNICCIDVEELVRRAEGAPLRSNFLMSRWHDMHDMNELNDVSDVKDMNEYIVYIYMYISDTIYNYIFIICIYV